MEWHRALRCLLPLLACYLAGCAPTPLRVVLVAGPNDHCGELPCHEYVEDVRLLAGCLAAPGGAGRRLKTSVYIGKRAPLGELRRTDALVVHSSADRKVGEWHALFPTYTGVDTFSATDQAYLRGVDREMKRGLGLLTLHYTNWVDHPGARAYFDDWLGGYFLRRQSKVKADRRLDKTTAVTTLEVATPAHPVVRGVSGWTAESEFYYDLHFAAPPDRRTPLLTAGLPLDAPAPQTVAWAWDRPGGARSVGFTGGHFHRNMYLDDYRTFLLNAILWAAGGEVPAAGFASDVPQP